MWDVVSLHTTLNCMCTICMYHRFAIVQYFINTSAFYFGSPPSTWCKGQRYHVSISKEEPKLIAINPHLFSLCRWICFCTTYAFEYTHPVVTWLSSLVWVLHNNCSSHSQQVHVPHGKNRKTGTKYDPTSIKFSTPFHLFATHMGYVSPLPTI